MSLLREQTVYFPIVKQKFQHPKPCLLPEQCIVLNRETIIRTALSRFPYYATRPKCQRVADIASSLTRDNELLDSVLSLHMTDHTVYRLTGDIHETLRH